MSIPSLETSRRFESSITLITPSSKSTEYSVFPRLNTIREPSGDHLRPSLVNLQFMLMRPGPQMASMWVMPDGRGVLVGIGVRGYLSSTTTLSGPHAWTTRVATARIAASTQDTLCETCAGIQSQSAVWYRVWIAIMSRRCGAQCQEPTLALITESSSNLDPEKLRPLADSPSWSSLLAVGQLPD